jgi:phosphoglycerate-specific signal transduction histidine kinase
MAKHSDDQQRALAGLLGLGDQSARKSHYPELAARLGELEAERNRYIRLNDELEQRVAARTDELLEANRNLQQQIAQRERVERTCAMPATPPKPPTAARTSTSPPPAMTCCNRSTPRAC